MYVYCGAKVVKRVERKKWEAILLLGEVVLKSELVQRLAKMGVRYFWGMSSLFLIKLRV